MRDLGLREQVDPNNCEWGAEDDTVLATCVKCLRTRSTGEDGAWRESATLSFLRRLRTPEAKVQSPRVCEDCRANDHTTKIARTAVFVLSVTAHSPPPERHSSVKTVPMQCVRVLHCPSCVSQASTVGHFFHGRLPEPSVRMSIGKLPDPRRRQDYVCPTRVRGSSIAQWQP